VTETVNELRAAIRDLRGGPRSRGFGADDFDDDDPDDD
jgi:hypothetical protein